MQVDRKRQLHDLFTNGDYTTLISEITSVEAATPFGAAILGQAAFRNGQFDEAINNFRTAFDLAPSSELLLNLTAALAAIGEPDMIAELLAVNPEFVSPEAATNHAIALLAVHDVSATREVIAGINGHSDEITAVQKALEYETQNEALEQQDDEKATGPELYLQIPRLTLAPPSAASAALPPRPNGRAGSNVALTPAQAAVADHNDLVLRLRANRLTGPSSYLREHFNDLTPTLTTGSPLRARAGEGWRRIPLFLARSHRLPRVHAARKCANTAASTATTAATAAAAPGRWTKKLSRKQRKLLKARGTGGHQGAL